jgi:hypothetical protein
MAFVEINPLYRPFLESLGLSEADHFLDLPGVVVSGHPDRHVVKVCLGDGPSAFTAFLKKEHRVAWKDRLANAWAGLGLYSKSYREAIMLRALRRADVECAEWIAVGEDDAGRAFVLVREVEGGRDLRAFLGDAANATPGRRRALARRLGQAVAKLHRAGFDHPDLYAKHVLVRDDGSVVLLDCQRCGRRRLTRRRRVRALAKLNASVDDGLADRTDRLVFLRAYLKATGASGRYALVRGPVAWLAIAFGRPGPSLPSTADSTLKRKRRGGTLRLRFRVLSSSPGLPRRDFEDSAPATQLPLNKMSRGFSLARLARAIVRESDRLLRRPRLREMRQPLVLDGRQEIVWLDGEALCVTRAFAAECRGEVRARLRLPRDGARGKNDVTASRVALPHGGAGLLVRRSTSRPFAWLRTRLRWRPWVAPEVAQAGTLFRLQRAGIETVTVLAFGQRHARPWQTDSFLLTAAPAGSRSLEDWVRTGGRLPQAAGRRARSHVVRETAALLRRLHEAGYALCPDASGVLPAAAMLVGPPADRPVVCVGDAAGVRRCRRLHDRRRQRDFVLVARVFRDRGCGRTDLLRQYLAYVDRRHLGSADKQWIRSRLPRELPLPRPAPDCPRGKPGTEEPVHEPGALLSECAAGPRRL